jgi:putative oxidoreductase
MITRLRGLHDHVFGAVERHFGPWLPALVARFVFAAVLLGYFLNSARTKIGDGPLGFLTVTDGAYAQIVPPVIEAHGFDVSQVPFVPWGLIVHLGTYAEIVLPVLIVLGLFTRLAALGMIGFVLVQSFVDIAFHHADDRTIGALFDRLPDSVILDQRSLWMVLLVYLVVRGAGMVSLDRLLARRGQAASSEPLGDPMAPAVNRTR